MFSQKMYNQNIQAGHFPSISMFLLANFPFILTCHPSNLPLICISQLTSYPLILVPSKIRKSWLVPTLKFTVIFTLKILNLKFFTLKLVNLRFFTKKVYISLPRFKTCYTSTQYNQDSPGFNLDSLFRAPKSVYQ